MPPHDDEGILSIAEQTVRDFRRLQKSGKIEDKIYFEANLKRLEDKILQIRIEERLLLTEKFPTQKKAWPPRKKEYNVLTRLKELFKKYTLWKRDSARNRISREQTLNEAL